MRQIGITLLLLLTLLPAAAESQGDDSWQRGLGDRPTLVRGIDQLRGALESGDVAAVSRQFRPGRVRLFIPSEGLSLVSVGHLHARTLLQTYFRQVPAADLAILPTRLGDGERLVWIVIEPAQEDSTGGRFIACYSLHEENWYLTELRCP